MLQTGRGAVPLLRARRLPRGHGGQRGAAGGIAEGGWSDRLHPFGAGDFSGLCHGVANGRDRRHFDDDFGQHLCSVAETCSSAARVQLDRSQRVFVDRLERCLGRGQRCFAGGRIGGDALLSGGLRVRLDRRFRGVDVHRRIRQAGRSNRTAGGLRAIASAGGGCVGGGDVLLRGHPRVRRILG